MFHVLFPVGDSDPPYVLRSDRDRRRDCTRQGVPEMKKKEVGGGFHHISFRSDVSVSEMCFPNRGDDDRFVLPEGSVEERETKKQKRGSEGGEIIPKRNNRKKEK